MIISKEITDIAKIGNNRMRVPKSAIAKLARTGLAVVRSLRYQGLARMTIYILPINRKMKPKTHNKTKK